jgi:hypothetical protein
VPAPDEPHPGATKSEVAAHAVITVIARSDLREIMSFAMSRI